MADQEKTIRDVIRGARENSEAERASVPDMTLPVITTGRGEELARASALAVGLPVHVSTNYAQKGGGPIPLIIDLESLVRQHGPDALKLLEAWAIKKIGESIWSRIVAWIREAQKRSPDGASAQLIAIDKSGKARNYKIPSKERLEAAIIQLPLDLDTPGVPGERLWFDGRWMSSSEYFKQSEQKK